MRPLALCLLLPLLTPGDAISCFSCTSTEGYNCSTSQQKCTTSVNSCITIARHGNTGVLDPTYEKKCNSDDRLCNQFYGLVAGDFRMLWNTSCCRADRCNTQEVIVQTSAQIPNGIRCNSCFARGTDFCLNHTTVACTGLLNNCIHFATSAKTGEFKDEQVAFTGCATRNMCDMGAGALFAAGHNVDIKVNTCSRALGISTQYSLVLPLLAGLLGFAFCS